MIVSVYILGYFGKRLFAFSIDNELRSGLSVSIHVQKKTHKKVQGFESILFYKLRYMSERTMTKFFCSAVDLIIDCGRSAQETCAYFNTLPEVIHVSIWTAINVAAPNLKLHWHIPAAIAARLGNWGKICEEASWLVEGGINKETMLCEEVSTGDVCGIVDGALAGVLAK